MPLFDEFADARAVSPAIIGAIQLAKTTGTYVGVTPLLITRPANVRLLTLRCEAGTIRLRPDKYDNENFNFTPNNVGESSNTISVGTHGLVSGDGPYQITERDASMVPLTSIVIDGPGKTFTRTVGSWATDGFWHKSIFTVSGSASNEGTFTCNVITNTVMTVDEAVTSEIAQTDLTITGPVVGVIGAEVLTNFWVIFDTSTTFKLALSRAAAIAATPFQDLIKTNATGLFRFGGSIGWAANAVVAANKTDGYGSVAIVAGEQITIAAPAELTIVGFSASDACSYWFGR